MKSALLRSVFVLTMLALSALAFANPVGYIPLQPGHTGHWHDPSQVGEGMSLSVFASANGPVFFGQLYFVVNGQQPWVGFDGITHTAWNGESYELVLYARDAVNGEPFSVGSAWLKPNAYGGMTWTVLIGDLAGKPVLREGLLSQLTQPVLDPIGKCEGTWTLPPPPPGPADPFFCH